VCGEADQGLANVSVRVPDRAAEVRPDTGHQDIRRRTTSDTDTERLIPTTERQAPRRGQHRSSAPAPRHRRPNTETPNLQSRQLNRHHTNEPFSGLSLLGGRTAEADCRLDLPEWRPYARRL
jgi:hypothetical protein